ncbi:Gmad2 immunoglobulin-like domain-containing protein [Bacillus sp. OTU530]|jgi:hypothetical protein|uniref:Gmad2 immunoglobulin-like domain-containing protein n=1 Tax=Bacillus sp. OTU530 TaxID=3043862 RepID=UPI00313C19DE
MMKKMYYFLAVLMAIVGLTACNQQKEEVREKTSVTEPKDDYKTDKESLDKNNEQESHDENTTNQNEPISNVPTDAVYQNEVFKDVVVSESENEIIITGKAQVFEGVFQYALYDGDKVLLENNYQTDGAPAWGEFKITFNKELVSTNETKFELFVYSAKDGSKVNTLEIPISKH